MREHPGTFLLCSDHHARVRDALARWRASHPSAVPGFNPGRGDRDGVDVGDVDPILARLMWLDFWIGRAPRDLQAAGDPQPLMRGRRKMMKDAFKRWCGDACIILLWEPDMRPGDEEAAGAWRVQIADAHGEVFSEFFLCRPNVTDLAAVDVVAAEAALACDVELARQRVAFEWRGSMAFVIKPYPPNGDATTRELVAHGRSLRRVDAHDKNSRSRAAATDAAAHIKNKLTPAMAFLDDLADKDKYAADALEALRAIDKFADALGGKGGG